MTTTEIYTLSLHDALPISDLAASAIRLSQPRWSPRRRLVDFCQSADLGRQLAHHISHVRRKLGVRSEEHTSELQSRRDLVCRLLLEKKKIANSLRCCIPLH